jgi:hypothetical protein
VPIWVPKIASITLAVLSLIVGLIAARLLNLLRRKMNRSDSHATRFPINLRDEVPGHDVCRGIFARWRWHMSRAIR